MTDVSFTEEAMHSGAKPREAWLVDWPYRDRDTGRLKHALYMFKTRAKAVSAAEAITKWLQEGDQEPKLLKSVLVWEEQE